MWLLLCGLKQLLAVVRKLWAGYELVSGTGNVQFLLRRTKRWRAWHAFHALKGLSGTDVYGHTETSVLLSPRRRQGFMHINVKNDLIRAKKWLEIARVSVDRNSVAVDEYETINQLEGDIEKISVSLDKKEKNLAGSIEGALHKLKAMAEREAEKIEIGWKTKRPDADVRADLIDAKQHVAFAENMQFYAKSDPADIFKSLDRVKTELDKAAKSGKLDSKASSELDLVTKDLAMIRKKPDDRGVYERIRARLRGLIHNNY